MRVLVVCQYYHPEPFAVTDFCEELARRGHEVTVLTGLPNYPEGVVPDEYRGGRSRREERNGVSIIRSFEVGRGRGALRRAANYLSFCLSASLEAWRVAPGFELVVVYQLSPVTMVLPAVVYRWRRRVPVLLYCLDLWPASLIAGGVSERSMVFRAFTHVSRYLYGKADRIAVTSESFRDYLSDYLDLDPQVISHLPQYADDAPSTVSSTQAAFGGKTSVRDVNLVFTGNVGRLQSLDTIIRAADLLKGDPRFKFHVVGDGSDLPECKMLAENLGLQSVTFHGRRPRGEMAAFYAGADALLLTMRDEPALAYTLPRKVQSYMAAGRPIIAAIGGEARRVIEDADCGLCGPPEDHARLAESCRQFADLVDHERMSRNALEYYHSHYDKQIFFDTLLGLMHQLVGRSA